MCVMNTQLLEALCKDFAAIYQCDLIQDTLDIVRFDNHPFSLHMALNNLHSKLKSYYRLYELHSLLLIHAKYG